MRHPDSAHRRNFLAAGVALLAGCAAIPSGPRRTDAAPAPRVRIGDRWRYERINRYNGHAIGDILAVVATVEPRIVVKLSDPQGASLGDEIYSVAWDVIQEPFYDLPQVFDTPVAIVPPGAAPGQHLNVQTRYRTPGDSPSLYWSERLDVLDWESVEVPAGRFDALRIERRIAFQHSDTFRQGSQRLDTIWYAPAVNRWVRRTWTGRYYLPGRRPVEVLEDSIDWRLLEYAPAA